MTQLQCSCGRPTAGTVLCSRCSRTLAFALLHVAGDFEDLETVATKRTRYAAPIATKVSAGKVQPLPVDLRFVNGAPRLEVFGGVGGPVTAPGTQLRWDTWNTLSTWCRVVMDEQPQVLGPRCAEPCLHVSCGTVSVRAWPSPSIRSMCLYLDRQHRWIESREWAGDLLDELTDLERRLARMVNRPPERWYAGKCDCGVDLYAATDHDSVDCSACSARYDVATRRDFLLEEAKNYLVTATEAAGALLAWTDYAGNEAGFVKLISQWHQHRRLATRGATTVNGKDRRLYRLGDVQELLLRHIQTQQSRRLSG